jgi:DNA-binding LytR/AlgR family response regulator
MEAMRPTDPDSGIFFKVKNRFEKVRFCEVLWVEADDVYSIIRTTKARFLVSHTLKAIEERFPKNTFIRVHRSFLVSLPKIDGLEDRSLIIGTEKIPVGKTYKPRLWSKLDFMKEEQGAT